MWETLNKAPPDVVAGGQPATPPVSLLKFSLIDPDRIKRHSQEIMAESRGRLISVHELPRADILGNPYPYTRMLMRYRGVGKRACSASFLEEFFSETQFPAFRIVGNSKARSRCDGAAGLFSSGFWQRLNRLT